jgi:hypothetical protein
MTAMDAALTDTATFHGLPSAAARMLAVEILLTDPQALGDDVFESCLYLYREKLRGVSESGRGTPAERVRASPCW